MRALPRSQRGLRFIAPFDTSGYSVAARRLLLGLKRAGLPFTWTPMRGGTSWGFWYEPHDGRSIGDPELDPYCNLPIAYDTVIANIMPEYLVRWRSSEPDRCLVNYTVWETEQLPHHWAVSLEMADRLLVPCTWNQRVFEQRKLTPGVGLLPYIARSPRRADGVRDFGIREDDFVFYCIEVWTARKALWRIVRAYLDAFTDRDAVCLVLKTSARDNTRRLLGRRRTTRDSLVRLLRDYPHPARIRLITERLPDDDISRLHQRGDCYVSLSSGEGWNLGAFDAAAYGNPSIISGHGGPLDYLPPELGYLVACRLVPVEDDLGKPSFLEDQTWAEPSIAHASRLMRDVFECQDEAARRGEALREQVRNRFSEQSVIAQLIRELDGLDP